MPHLTQPLLIVHGEHDSAIPVEDAQKAIAAAGSVDKELRIFTIAEGGSEHVSADDPDPARQLITDWFADRLHTVPATPRVRPDTMADRHDVTMTWPHAPFGPPEIAGTDAARAQDHSPTGTYFQQE